MKTRCASLTHSVIPTRFPMCAPSRTRMKYPQTVTVYPEKNENKAAYLLWRSLRAALLTAGALIALMVIWNVDLKGLFVLPIGGAVTVLLAASQGIISVRKIPCRRLSSFCGNFDELIVKIDGFAKKVDKFLMM